MWKLLVAGVLVLSLACQSFTNCSDAVDYSEVWDVSRDQQRWREDLQMLVTTMKAIQLRKTYSHFDSSWLKKNKAHLSVTMYPTYAQPMYAAETMERPTIWAGRGCSCQQISGRRGLKLTSEVLILL